MAADKVSAVHAGGVGYFWINNKNLKKVTQPSERGYIKLGDSGLIEITTLDERPHAGVKGEDFHGPSVGSITAATEHGGLLLLSMAGRGRSMSMGGPTASVRRYKARSLIVGVPLDSLRSPRVKALTLHFASIDHFFGLSAFSEQFVRDDGGLLRGYSANLSDSEEVCVGLNSGLELAISSHWAVSGPEDRRVLYTPTAVTCRADRPRAIEDLRWVLAWTHGLLCLAHFGCLVADGGSAELDCDSSGSRPAYWDSRFMVRPVGAPSPEFGFPLFSLETIGGIDALRRWRKLCVEHPRAARPLIEPYAGSGRSAPVRLLEVAAAIEYWVNTHRRRTNWAKKHNLRPYALAQHVGGAFADWVGGDMYSWADQFWACYNALKHEPGFAPEFSRIGALAESGALLLQAHLLDRIAGNKQPSKRIFGGRRLWQLSDAVKDAVANPPSRPKGRLKTSRLHLGT